MPTSETPRVAIAALGRAAARGLIFQAGGQLRVVAVVKAGFVMAQDGPMILSDPDPFVERDQHRDGNPVRSLAAASDLVPYRPRADVLLYGHARAPLGGKAARVGLRLMVARGQEMMIDKRIGAQGPPDAQGAPAPFTSIPITYEHAARAVENPAGVAAEAGEAPGIVDRWYRAAPVGFGPIGAVWPARARLLRDPAALRAPIPALTADFPWAYFNAAPPDQQTAFLQGDEWVGFEGMNSQIPRVQSCLPGARAVAKLYGPEPGLLAGRAIALVADTLTIDADRLRVSVVWRGSFAVSSEAALESLVVVAGVEAPGEPAALPASYAAARALAPPPAPVKAPAKVQEVTDPTATMALSLDDIEAAVGAQALPFGPGAPPRRAKVDKATTALSLAEIARAASAEALPFAHEGPAPPRAVSERPLPPATPFERPAHAGEEEATCTIDLSPAPVMRPAATPFTDAPHDVPPPPLLKSAAPPPEDDELSTIDVSPEEAGMRRAAPTPFDAPEDPKTLGEHFLAAIARTNGIGGAQSSARA